MNSNIKIIKKIVMEKSKDITFDKEELTEQMEKIALKFFDEPCCVYLDKIDDSKYTLEVHFDDCNYYEIDISDTDTIEIFSENILRDFVNERFIDKESNGENRNNIRYIRKYC